MLCERCQRFDVQAFGRDPYPYRGVPRLSVIRSSDHCSFCSLLLENLQEANADDSIKEITIAYQRFQQLSTRESLSFETLGLLRWLLYELINPGWVNFAVTKATKQPIVGSDGFNVVSIDAFVGSLDRFDRLMPRKHPRRSLLLDLTDPLLRPRRVKFHVAADPGTPASTSQDITGQIITDRPWSSTKSIESIQKWHSDCVSNHPECRKTLSGTQSCQSESTLLPTRCIETMLVATHDGASRWRHVLRETADQKGQYISLRHRWDTETETSKTTPANYMRRMGRCLQETDHGRACNSGIEWMPRLFAEFCILAHSLGIKYVWIDSICIRQGDEEEWNREVPQMTRYYQNAWVTVVAANNEMANGLLNMRRIEPVPRMTRLPYMDRNGEQKGYFYLQRARPDVIQKEFSVGVEKSELLQRGWVFQEWRLSRRIIAFSDSGFFLYCHTLGSMSPMGDHLNRAGVPRGQNSQCYGHIMLDRNFTPSIEWEDIVSEYSGLALTCLAKDRLMALAAVASEFGRIVEALKITSNFSDRI